MRTVEFRRLLNDGNALRVRFELEQGLVTKFVVQLDGYEKKGRRCSQVRCRAEYHLGGRVDGLFAKETARVQLVAG